MSAPTSSSPGGVRVPAWLPPVLYGLLTLVLFREFVFSDRMLFGSDTLNLGYTMRAFYAEQLRSGVFPLWNPLVLGGTPLLESLSTGDALYPPSLLLLLVMEPFRALGWKLVLHVFLAGLFMFGWVRALGGSKAAALLAGIAYGLAPFLVSFVQPGHDGKLFVASLTPLVFAMTERLFARKGLAPVAALAVVIGLVILTTHFQMAYFLFGAVGAYAILRTVQTWRGEGEDTRKRALSRSGLFLAAAVAGAGIAAVQLAPAVSYVLDHSRRTATTTAANEGDNVLYSSSWSLHPEEVVSLAVPEFAGNGSGGADWATDTYWGRNALKDNHEYAGLVVLILAGLGLLGGPRRGLRGFFAGLAVVALLYALGRHTPVWRIFYEVLPGISLFRAPSIASFLFGFSAITLAAFGVDRVLGGREGEGGGADAWSVRLPWIVTAALFAFMLAAATGVLFTFWSGVVYTEMTTFAAAAFSRAQPFIVRGAFLATALAGATAATLWAGRRGYLKPSGMVVVLALLLALDALRVGGAFVQTWDFERWTAPDPNIEFLLARQDVEDPFRVASLNQSGQDVRPTIFGLELATGHHPNDLQRYRELIGMRGSGMPEHLLQPNVFRVLNVRYLIWPARFRAPEQLEPVSATQIGGQPYEWVFPLSGLPRARLVSEAVVRSDSEAVPTILDPSFDPATTAVLAEEPPLALGGGTAEGIVTWEERSVNRQRLRVVTDRNALLIVADNWFPGWQASVDGAAAPVLRAYHTLRAVPVPAGEHVVELRYVSSELRGSLAVSLVSLLLVVGVGTVSSWRRRGAASG